MKRYQDTRTPQYWTVVPKNSNILFTVEGSKEAPKLVGKSKDGKFRSFAYLPLDGATTNAKRAIVSEYEGRKHV